MYTKLYWKIRYRIEEISKRIRFRNIEKYKPFYDKHSKTYRVFFHDRHDEEGCIGYVVSEYTRGGLYYSFDIYGRHNHEHTYEGILETIMHNDGGFSVRDEDKKYYSEQELRMLYAYSEKLERKKNKRKNVKAYKQRP